MSEVTDANVDLIAAVLDLADPRDTRYYHRVKALCERLGTYMAMTEQQIAEERSVLAQDFLTLTRTVGMQAKRLRTAEMLLIDQSRSIRDLTLALAEIERGTTTLGEVPSLSEGMHVVVRALAHQAEQITALNATVIELMDRAQQVEARLVEAGTSS